MWVFTWAVLVILTISVYTQRALQMISWFDDQAASPYSCLSQNFRRARIVQWSEAFAWVNACALYYVGIREIRRSPDVLVEESMAGLTGGDLLFMMAAILIACRLATKAIMYQKYENSNRHHVVDLNRNPSVLGMGHDDTQSECVRERSFGDVMAFWKRTKQDKDEAAGEKESSGFSFWKKDRQAKSKADEEMGPSSLSFYKASK